MNVQEVGILAHILMWANDDFLNSLYNGKKRPGSYERTMIE